MEKVYHQLISVTVLAAMPRLAEFFEAEGYPHARIEEDAIRPDTVYHDSMMQNAELHHAHSIKLAPGPAGSLRWQDGDCIDSIKAYAGMIVRHYRSKDFSLVCRYLIELSHYLVDAMTLPHLVRGKPWSDFHMSFEIDQARWLEEHVGVLGPLSFTREKSVFRAALARAKALYPEAQDVAQCLDQGSYLFLGMTDADAMTYARKIAIAVGSTWLTITDPLFPKE